ncbi:MAG TPA: asparagine synthase-related protein [Allosphingosinicella sp.]
MTALAGHWSFGAGDPIAECERMLRAQQIYAPDPGVSRAAGSAALGRRLFRLTPEDGFDRGPEVSGSRILVADARLDNRPELAAALGISPADSASLSDAALLMRALDRWNEEAADRLTGYFAFALWDSDAQKLLLARDFLGHRPLHYHRGDGFFAFASMPKGLHALDGVPVAPNPRMAADFLALMPDNGSETFFEGIEKLIPGHIAIVTRDGIETRRYWHPPATLLRLKSGAEYEEALREKVESAVAVQLRGAEREVGAHLSGGLDSGTVAATAARILAPSGGKVTAFTSVPREGYTGGIRNAISDEGPLSAAVAALYPNMEQVLIRSGGRSPFSNLDRNFFLFERPVLNLCNEVWLEAIAEEAKRRGLKILLGGALGNLSISYDGMQLLSQLLRRGRLLRLGREIGGLLRNGTRVGTIASQTLGPYLPAPAWRMVQRLRGKPVGLHGYSAINPDSVAANAVVARAAERGLDLSYRPRSDPVETRLWAIDRVDPGNYVKGWLGGWGIDMRDPTADRRLIEFCLTVPAEQFLAGGIPRSLARRAFADRLPAEVVRERCKGYQAADWHEGFAAGLDDLRMEVERFAEIEGTTDALDTRRLAGLVERLPEGGWHDDLVTGNYRLALMRGVSAGHFLRKAAGSNR